MAKKRNNYWENQFNNMDSIYDEQGNYRTWENLGLGSEEEYNKFIQEANKAQDKGYGSFTYGSGANKKNYTIYKKNNGKIIKTWDPSYHSTYSKDDNGQVTYTDRSEYAAHKFYNPNSTAKFIEPTRELVPPTLEEEKNYTEKLITDNTPENNSYETELRNLSSVPNTGRLSQIRQHEQLLTNPTQYFNNPQVIRNMNKYYGMGYVKNNHNAEDNVRNTFRFVLNNSNLINDRRGKGMDYLPMESSRLDRKLGGYNFTYRDMLNYFNNNQNIGNVGKYVGDNNKFMQELYELGASRNGMQGHELQRLFGSDYDKILQNVSPNSMKQGGVLRMLFI